MNRLCLTLAACLLLTCALAIPPVAAEGPSSADTEQVIESVAGDAVGVEKVEALSHEAYLSIVASFAIDRATFAYGCPANSAFSCSGSCITQRLICFGNCNGDWDCIDTCQLCYRECAITC